MATQTYTGTLIVEECCTCHMDFGITRAFYNRAREQGPAMTFYCPAGHPQVYSQSDIAKLKAQLASAQDRADMAEQDARNAEYRRRAAVGQLTKTRKRISNGVCPCCQRTFTNVAAHMRDKHPDYARAEVNNTMSEIDETGAAEAEEAKEGDAEHEEHAEGERDDAED